MRTNFKQLLDAGVHFGHQKRKWNPAMAPYIFMEKNGIQINWISEGNINEVLNVINKRILLL